MILNGKHISEDARMALLREEEAHLGLWQEYPSNALISARLSLVSTATPPHSPPSSKAAPREAAKANSLPSDEECFSAGLKAEVLT